MTEMRKIYADAFISRVLDGKLPLEMKIGGEKLGERFGACESVDGRTVRVAELAGVRAVADFRIFDGAVEFGVTLVNTADTNSPQINGIDFLSLFVANFADEAWGWNTRRVLYSIGSPTTVYDFQPREEDLARPSWLTIDASEPRSSSAYMPYFCYSSDDREGVIAAIGWSGHWRADFRPEGDGTRIRFSYDADFYLAPGESVALPRVLLMPWKRDFDGDRDLCDIFVDFRRLVRLELLPKQDGKPIDGMVCLRAWGSVNMEGHEKRFANMRRFGLTGDAYGVDAGWYSIDGQNGSGDWFSTTGDWCERSDSYPNGIDKMADGGRENGCDGFWLWFEFERAMKSSAQYKAHPENYLNVPSLPFALVNMGDAAVREHMRSVLYPTIAKTKMTLFRVDFNIDPHPFLGSGDTENRRGITELKYYNGLYEFFDQMLADFPGLKIDNCASGGRRLDYRMCERSIPVMCRSDYWTIPRFDPDGEQAQTIGISRWLPSTGDCNGSCLRPDSIVIDSYDARSCYGASFGISIPERDISDEVGKWYRKTIDESKLVRDYMPLDFWPLTGYSLSKRDWCAFECVDYDGSRALVMAFRRELNGTPEQVFALKGLNKSSQYELIDADFGKLGELSGDELMRGFTVRIENARASRLITLREI